MLFSELKKLWQITCFQRSPECLQYSRVFLVLLLGLICLAQWVAKQQSMPEQQGFLWLYLVVILLLIRVLPFILFNKSERLVQGLTALFGTDLIISLPLLTALMVFDATEKNIILAVLFLLSSTWRLMANTFIYKFSLDIGWIKSAALVFILTVVNIIAVSSIANLLEN